MPTVGQRERDTETGVRTCGNSRTARERETERRERQRGERRRHSERQTETDGKTDGETSWFYCANVLVHYPLEIG